MAEPFLHSDIVVPPHRLSNITAWACALTLITMGLGSAFALYQNWQVRLDTSNIQLIRGAEMVNMSYPAGKNHGGKYVGRKQKRPVRGVFIEALAETKGFSYI